MLVFEYMAEGTVWDAVETAGLRWPEGKVRAEIRALLKVLRRMHGVWVIHRDIKPDNVYLRDGRLVLGDFGITELALDQKGADASKFQPDFAPRDLASSTMWGPAEDIFQVGLLAATLLSGEIGGRRALRAGITRSTRATRSRADWHATGRAPSATGTPTTARRALLAAPGRRDARPGAAHPGGQPVVFTGRLDGMTRTQAVARAGRPGRTRSPG